MTTKELEYLNDTLKGEQVIIKKYQDYSQSIQNPQLKAVCTDLVQKHQDHYSQLIQQLNS
ncbi:MAG: ferritin-like domain-containing protein [Vallitaleaceae bacterium]|nr:ferritin-like domain-containing protein [Vallitaleaceae bacterium]